MEIFEFKIPILTKSHIKQQWTQFKIEQKKQKQTKQSISLLYLSLSQQPNSETNIIKTQLWEAVLFKSVIYFHQSKTPTHFTIRIIQRFKSTTKIQMKA